MVQRLGSPALRSGDIAFDAKQACIASTSEVMQDASRIQKYFLRVPVKEHPTDAVSDAEPRPPIKLFSSCNGYAV